MADVMTRDNNVVYKVAYWTKNVVELTFRLLMDPDVPGKAKWRIAISAVYFAIPIDLVPEKFLPVIGRVDDGLVILNALRVLLADTDEQVVSRHWKGEPGDLQRLRDALARWDDKVKLTLSNLMERILGQGQAENGAEVLH